MPHFKTIKLGNKVFPIKESINSDSFIFDDRLYSVLYPQLSLILARYTNIDKNSVSHEFLLEIKELKETLVKCNKDTKIAPIEIMKNALKAFAKDEDIISHNLSPNKISSDLKFPFIHHINDFLNFNDFISSKKAKEKEIWIEIGFGSGRNLIHNAQNYPNILHIGLEIHTPSIEQVARQIGLMHLKNVSILSYDARIFLELLPSNIIDKILVHFPVPWDKSPHRRIFSEIFIKQASRVLKNGKTLELRTDSKEYFLYAKELACKNNSISLNEFTNKEANIVSKYEARWQKMDKDIYDLILTSLVDSSQIVNNYNFSFNNIELLSKCMNGNNFAKQKIIKDGYFVSIDDMFVSKNGKKMLKISFGDFNYPESRYIIIDKEVRYLKSSPLPTLINQKCHNILCDLLFRR